MNKPMKPTHKRRNSLKKQWDKTTKVVNVNQKFYSNVADKYTELQIATFTKWVNIQLRAIEEGIDESACLSPATIIPFNKTKKKMPEIKAIDKDFRDGKKLIELLELFYENDVEELPKPERGKTRLHYIQNVNKVLEFLQKKLDDNGLIALKAIGPVDIVDGNVKLTLGLIWLMISKFHQMISDVFEVTEEELNQVEERFKENSSVIGEGHSEERVDKDDNKIKSSKLFINTTFEEFQTKFRNHFVESSNSSDSSIFGSPTIFEEEPEEIIYENKAIKNRNESTENEQKSIDNQLNENDTAKPALRNNSVRNRILLNSSNRLSLPPNYNNEGKKNFNPNSPSRFRTLRLKSSSSSPTNSSSGLLFWINMQLIDYASILPSTCYPIEDFTGMNDGVILAALIHHLDMEWIEDFDLLIKDGDGDGENESDKEIRIKERLTKCFNILNDRLNIIRPKALISMLIEKDYSDKERLKRTGLGWSVYISEIFLSVTHTRNKEKEMRSRMISLDENEETTEFKETEEISSNKIDDNNGVRLRDGDNNNTSPSKRNSMATSNLPLLPPWTPKVSLISAVWDWTLSWMKDDNDNDNYDSDDYDKSGKLKEREMRTISRGSFRKSKQNNWDIKNANEWQSDKNESGDALRLLVNTQQPLYMYWN